jgi:hypothetical protein
MSQEMMEQALRAAVDEVIEEFNDGILRTGDIRRQSGLEWRIDFTYYESQWIMPLVIKEEYPDIPDHDWLKAKIRSHVLAHPPATH